MSDIRRRMLEDEELPDNRFEQFAYRIALEAHEDRMKLWGDLSIKDERIAQLEAVLQAISQDEFRDEWKLSEEYIDDDYWRIVNIARVALTSAPETP